MKIDKLETPAVLIEKETLDANLRSMSEYCKKHGLSLRPHAKTHKIPEIAHLQTKYGATGITVAKLGEAEIMADAGLRDIVIVYPLWGENKWKRLAELAGRVRVSVAMDSFEVAKGISRAAQQADVEIGIRLEFDTGFGRCGLPIEQRSIECALRILALPKIRWEGVSVYPGHIMGSRQVREQDIVRENIRLDRLFALLHAGGIPYAVVSGGNTPAALESHRFHGLTEIRPGTYVFNDRNTVEAESAGYADCAATVLATVVSTSVPGRAIIDAGSKVLSGDALLSGEKKYFGQVREHPEATLGDLSEEHGHLFLSEGAVFRVGDRLRIIPNHICPCINLQDHVFLVSGDEVLDRWKVAARGAVT